MAHGYRKAILKQDYKGETVEIDVVVKSATSELEKKMMFRPDTKIGAGAYISYANKTYILRELDIDQITPKGLAFYCNRYISFNGGKESLPCYTNSTTYGSKGILDQEKFYELDSKTKVYIQKNSLSDTLYVGQRIMFDKKYVYKITEVDDLVYDGMYIIVCQRDEVLPMDDFDNNIAYNKNSVPEEEQEEESCLITGNDTIRIGTTQTYFINTNGGSWVLDDESLVSYIEEDNQIEITALSFGWINLSYVNTDGEVIADLDILCAK